MKKILALIMLLFAASMAYGQSYCSGYDGSYDAGTYYTTLDINGKSVQVFKTNSAISICAYDNFCEQKGMYWYAPSSPAEADLVLTEVRALDNYHTWILTMAPTILGPQGVATWNGQVLTTIDSPYCSEGSTEGFGAIRDWGCSMCDPEDYGTSRCWDNDHQYDWILCTGEYVPPGDNGGDVPEFTLIGAGLVALTGAGYAVWRRRK